MLNEEKINAIAEEYGTPFYLFDLDALSRRIRDMQEILGQDVTICYAMKANPFLVHAIRALPAKYEVCSPGEFAICEREQIPMERIVLSGVNKEEQDVQHVMRDCGGVGMFTAESVVQFHLLADCAAANGMEISVLLRVTSGNQFGMDETEIRKLVAERKQYPQVHIRGIQCYTGTQKKKLSHIEREIQWLDGLCDSLQEEYGFHAEELEYGPGLCVKYFGREAYENDFADLKEFAAMLDPIRSKYHITLEMGRYIVADCGMFVSAVADIKTNKGQNYCIIDGGIHHMNYYGQTMAMKIPAYTYLHRDHTAVHGNDENLDQLDKWTICGSLCTVGDVVVKNLPIGQPHLGDRIIFYQIGAYSVTEAIFLFLSRRMPKILAWSEKNGVECYRDVLPADRINSRQQLL